MPGEQPNSVADRVNGGIETRPYIIDHHHRANSLIDLTSIHRIEDRVRPTPRRHLAADGLRSCIMHHFLKDGERAAARRLQALGHTVRLLPPMAQYQTA
jgi:hypothetical protein